MGPTRPILDRPLTWRRLPRSRVPLHRRLVRDRAVIRHWLVVAVLAWILAALVTSAVGRAETTQRRWGRTAAAWVAVRPLRAGDALDGALREERWPEALLPPSAARPQPGTRAAAPIDEGSVVTDAMVARPEAAGRTVAVPLPDAHLPVREGDRVDVWATSDPAVAADGRGETERVAADARVVAAPDGAVVLEVDPARVAAVAEAGASATITLVGRP